jgi:hypothetical protein
MKGRILDKCLIWETIAHKQLNHEGLISLSSPKAGGQYLVNPNMQEQVRSIGFNHRVTLTTWLVEQRNTGNHSPEITETILEQTRSRKRMSIQSRVDKLLHFIDQNCYSLGSQLEILPDQDFIQFIQAHTESNSSTEVFKLIEFAKKLGFLSTDLQSIWQEITFEGHQHLEKIRSAHIESNQAFIAMWFNDLTATAYDEGIAPAISNAGYRPMRIDSKEHSNKIDDEII